MAAALEGAGGLTSLAGAERVLLERIDNHSSRRVEEFALDASGLARLLQDGDLLRIFPLSPKFENAVTLRGNVAEPGRYVWKEGMRVSDLIPSRDFLITRDFWNRQNQPTPTQYRSSVRNPACRPVRKPADRRVRKTGAWISMEISAGTSRQPAHGQSATAHGSVRQPAHG